MLHFEDFSEGQVFALDGRYEVTKDEVIAFASHFDPQPMHLDEEAAKASPLGGLAASGWHVCSMAMRLIVDGLFNQTAAAGGAGTEDCRWLKPVRPGDVLRLEVHVLNTSAHPRRSDIGFVKTRWDLFAGDSLVAQITSTPMVKRRGA